MRSGLCDAALHDDALITRLMKMERWGKFSATLPPRDPRRLAIITAQHRADVARVFADLARRWQSNSGWATWLGAWAADIDFEAYLEQDAPDCH